MTLLPVLTNITPDHILVKISSYLAKFITVHIL